MTLDIIALGLLVGYAAVAFGLRSWIQYRRTGNTGLRGIGGSPGSLEWWAGVGLVVAFGGLGATPVLALVGGAAGRPLVSDAGVAIAGVALFAVGFVATFAAQLAMGTSWRIGVRADEVTELVTGGSFAIVRNPIFSAMLVTSAGLVLMIPSVVAVASLAVAVVALELQVRLVEEPYLLRTHGARYADYAARVGRFLPWVGRLRARPDRRSPVVEATAVAMVAGATTSLIWIVPDNPFAHLGEPHYLAIIGLLATLVALAALRAMGAGGRRHEQRLLALFLVAMPVVYVASAWLVDAGATALWFEAAGLVGYGALAWFGGARWLPALALGIAAHGAWDLAHYQRSGYTPDWYAVACVVVDVSLGFYVWTSRVRLRETA